MKHRCLASLRALLMLALVAPALLAVEPPAARPETVAATTPKPRHFLLVLRLAPRLHEEKAWTDADHATVDAHFNRLKSAVDTGQVLLAGRTEEPLDKTFGLVIFTAADETSAQDFVSGDPCVAAGVMTAELHPYGVALRAK